MKKQRGTGATTAYTSKLDAIDKIIMRNIVKYQGPWSTGAGRTPSPRDKINGKKGTDGCRLLHSLFPSGKAWATAVSKENVPTVQSYAFGFPRGRRREGAVLAQQVAA